MTKRFQKNKLVKIKMTNSLKRPTINNVLGVYAHYRTHKLELCERVKNDIIKRKFNINNMNEPGLGFTPQTDKVVFRQRLGKQDVITQLQDACQLTEDGIKTWFPLLDEQPDDSDYFFFTPKERFPGQEEATKLMVMVLNGPHGDLCIYSTNVQIEGGNAWLHLIPKESVKQSNHFPPHHTTGY